MQNQISDIDAAIAKLEALKAECTPNDCRTLSRQVASYKAAKDVAKRANEICGDLLVRLAEEAVSRADCELTKADRAYIRSDEPITEALHSADRWVDDVEAETPVSRVYSALQAAE